MCCLSDCGVGVGVGVEDRDSEEDGGEEGDAAEGEVEALIAAAAAGVLVWEGVGLKWRRMPRRTCSGGVLAAVMLVGICDT
mmetsp:Transcript_21013/g.40547  ORF Transcript_21013/g.40547 Transcript_21013/m.40547 type:complete len:81 (+) Transcript_21013:63-305(+)